MRALLLAGVVSLALVRVAQASYIIDFEQLGLDVVATGTGSINTTSLGPPVQRMPQLALRPSVGYEILGFTSNDVSRYNSTLTGPSNFGSDIISLPSNSTGSFVGIIVSVNYVIVPADYLSGAALANTATFANATFNTLGLAAGTYDYTFGVGDSLDSYTIKVGPSATDVPEPASLALLGMGVAGIVAVCRRRRETPAE